MELTDHCYKLLQKVRLELQFQPEVVRPMKNASLKHLEKWCQYHDLETLYWLSGSKACFTPQVLSSIDTLLTALGQPLIDQVHSGQSSLEQAKHGYTENKNRSRPMQGRLLVLVSNVDDWQPAGLLQTPTELVLNIHYNQLDLDVYDRLLVVENLDVFCQCLELQREGCYQLPPFYGATLIVYRGHQHDANTVVRLIKTFRLRNKATVYFGDFDAAGLGISLRDGYSHILLPELEFLAEYAHAAHNPSEQLQQIKWLQRRTLDMPANKPLYSYLKIILQEQRGLKQQWYQGALQCLPLLQNTENEEDDV